MPNPVINRRTGGSKKFPPSGFSFASNTTFSNIVAAWNPVPAPTQLYTSSDGVSYSLAQTLGPGVTSANVAVPSVGSTVYAKIISGGTSSSALQFTRTDWETRVIANLGTPLAFSLATQNNLYSALANVGILSKMINVGFFENNSGNSIRICLTPIIKTIGTNVWSNINMGDGMMGANGVTPTGGPGVGARPGILGTDFPSDNDGGYTVYAFTGAEVLNACSLGYTNNAGSISTAFQIQTGGNTRAALWNDTSRIVVPSNGAGYYSLNRTGAAALNLYYAKTATAHASIGSSAAAAGSRNSNFVDFFSVNAFEAGIPELFTVNNTLRLLAVHHGLTQAESLLFYNAIVSAITFFGGTPV
jgi:hypothetical protein